MYPVNLSKEKIDHLRGTLYDLAKRHPIRSNSKIEAGLLESKLSPKHHHHRGGPSTIYHKYNRLANFLLARSVRHSSSSGREDGDG